MRPSVGVSTPVSRLIRVVLPAPSSPQRQRQIDMVGGNDAIESLDQAERLKHDLAHDEVSLRRFQ
jgi:hypothetical protein